ncbi:hypothetical protein [Puia sp.]|uniref:hypothetical protein n=1 Tax=Puia sp. TaxID=2045100 RepID=UPI002F3E546C
MKRSLLMYLPALLVIAGMAFAGCGGGDASPKKMAADSVSPTGPAPDNNSANNPSLADTNYEKDRTRPITDTMKPKR